MKKIFLLLLFVLFTTNISFAKDPTILEYNKQDKTIKVEIEGKEYVLPVPQDVAEIPRQDNISTTKKTQYAKGPLSTEASPRLYNIPTDTLLKRNGFRFDFTHRFSSPIDESTANDVYGLDSFSYTGIGLYYGITNNFEAHAFRSSLTDASEFGLKYQVFKEAKKWRDGAPFGLTLSSGFQNDNIQNSIDPYIQGIFTKVIIPDWFKLYFAPTYANKSATIGMANSLSASFFTFLDPKERGYKRTSGTFALPFGGAVKLLPNGRLSLFGEYVPVVSGYKEVENGWSFGLQVLSRLETHVWTIGISNVPYSTLGQFIVGGPSNNWHIGFNIAAKIK